MFSAIYRTNIRAYAQDVVKNLFCMPTHVYNERKFMNEDTKPTTGMPAPTTAVETKPADQKSAAPTPTK
jgi:hypothetical protein